MATRNKTIYKEMTSGKTSYQIYDRSGKLFASELQGNVLRRLKVDERTAMRLMDSTPDIITALLDEAQQQGSSDFYLVRTNDKTRSY